jgi:signal transduction histidine kinase
MAEFFQNHIIEVFFFYGLSFFSMGLVVWLELGHTSELDFAQALRPLAGFGLVHGIHEWFEMFLLLRPEFLCNANTEWICVSRLTMLGVSFLMLVAFGARLIAGPANQRLKYTMQGIIIGLWLVGLWSISRQFTNWNDLVIAADVYTRYSLAIPGATLTVWGLLLQRRKFIQADMHSFGNDVALAAVAFGMYGGIGQFFASPSAIFPSEFINADVFITWFGLPIQVFRAAMACMAAVFIIRSLRAFEVETRQRIEALRKAQREERHRLENVRAELLHRTVKAQESERQRIARELHDETGQTLTALGMGLRAVSDTLQTNPEKALTQTRRLEEVAAGGIEQLQRLVSGLHPPQLDDLGLMAALRWYVNEMQTLYGLPIELSKTGKGNLQDIPSELRIVLFRIAQEAVTNIVRHAYANHAAIKLDQSEPQIHLTIEDDGVGFDINSIIKDEANRPHWGLLGMQERAFLVGGRCEIYSTPGKGACVEVIIPWEMKNEPDSPATG